MSYIFPPDDRLFGRNDRINNDVSASISRDVSNNTSANYVLAQLHSVGAVRPNVNFAVQNDLSFNGVAAGIGPSQIAQDSQLRLAGYANMNSRDVRLEPINPRPFLCPANIRKGSVDPNLESKLRSGVRVGYEARSAQEIKENNYVLHPPPIHEDRWRPMESEVVDGWVLGGIHTRASRDNL